eukprot:s72_g3.t1
MVCAQIGYVHCTPVRHKNQFDVMVRELVSMAQLLGHTDLSLMCDNEPSTRQLLRMAVNTRLAMGLPTRSTTPPAYSHGNSLVENAVGRIRPLAGSLMHALSLKLGIEISTNSHLWTWAMRHADWLINRFGVTPGRGMTSYELLANKPYGGKICQFGEPVFGYQKSAAKGNPRWKRMLFLGKIDPQDSFLLCNGENLVLAKSVRRINTCWKAHLAFYLNCKCASFDFKSGSGGRVVPTRSSRAPMAPGFNPPAGEIEQSQFFDEDAHAVRQKALEEQREDYETASMALHDRVQPAAEVEQPIQEEGAEVMMPKQPAVLVEDDDPGPNPAFSGIEAPVTPLSYFAAPSTPPMTATDVPSSSTAASSSMPMVVPRTPRSSPMTRQHDVEETADDQPHRRAHVEDSKRSRLMRVKAQYASMVRVVKFDDGSEYHTMDDYSQDLQMTDHEEDDDPWQDDPISFTTKPAELWSDHDIETKPCDPPQHVDDLADEVEIMRVCGMGVLQRASAFKGIAEDGHKLTAKFVRDWRVKAFDGGGAVETDAKPVMKWLRRSRLVAREYAFLEKRQDVYAPASPTHVLNLLPLMWLQRQADMDEVSGGATAEAQMLATLDVKDAFLEVPQPTAFRVTLAGEVFVVLRNLPGQRFGAKAWYWFIRGVFEDNLNYEWCTIHPCLARCKDSAIVVHVDVLYVGNQSHWKTFKEKLQNRFTISVSELGEAGAGILKLVKSFEDRFGKVRNSTTPADQGLQMVDNSPMLAAADARFYRMAVGMCLYLARDRPDVAFTVKELSSYMSSPTVNALKHLKRLVGYFKNTPSYTMVLQKPVGGQGIQKKSSEQYWLLESFSDSDWSSDRRHRKSTSSGVHMLCGNFVYSSSRTQRVISLSSCEAELHGMISTLCDGIFIKRCAEFIGNCTIERVLH